MNSVLEQGFLHESAFDNNTLKTFIEFRILKIFEVRTLTNSNFITSLPVCKDSLPTCNHIIILIKLRSAMFTILVKTIANTNYNTFVTTILFTAYYIQQCSIFPTVIS